MCSLNISDRRVIVVAAISLEFSVSFAFSSQSSPTIELCNLFKRDKILLFSSFRYAVLSSRANTPSVIFVLASCVEPASH